MNMRGVERAVATRVHEIGGVACSTDAFGVANQGRSASETIEDAIAVIHAARAAGRRAQATITVAFGCPFEGAVPVERVVDAARRIAAAEPHEIAIADTIGVATPGQVRSVMRAVRAAVPGMPLRLHFHDTRNMAVARRRMADMVPSCHAPRCNRVRPGDRRCGRRASAPSGSPNPPGPWSTAEVL